jgi:hypothetical protein
VSFGFTTHGDFKVIETFLKRVSTGDLYSQLDSYGQQGVEALRKATPKRSSETAESWGYRVIKSKTNPGIEWYNTHTNRGANIAILIQYGHGTGTGGYVQGIDYINPAMRPLFEKIADDIWKEVTK